MTVDNHEIERIFDALQNLDRKLDDAKTSLATVSAMAQVTASKMEDIAARAQKLERGIDELDKEKAEAKSVDALWLELGKVRTTAQELSIKGKIVWGVIVAAATVGVEVFLKFMFHIQ